MLSLASSPSCQISTMDDQALYRDLQLPLPGKDGVVCFRLLKLKQSDTGFDSTLKVFPLSHAPSYKALSYSWGDPKDPRPLLCNDVSLPITRNLHTALTSLAPDYAGQYLWIDAVCINQNNLALTEREHQVSIMRDIYSCADEVIVWLIPSPFGTTSQSKHLGNAHLVCAAGKEFAEKMRLSIEVVASVIGNADHESIGRQATDLALRVRPLSGAEHDALLELLRQPYWNRVWIIQELCVAKEIRIHTGTDSVLWDDFKWLLLMMERAMFHDFRGLEANVRALNELRREYHEESASTRRLADLLHRFRWAGATNKLDKVYSLVGLVSTNDRDRVKIEYSISPAMCYTRVMFDLLVQSRDLSFLTYCNTPSFIRSRIKALPSWVPDWSYDASHMPAARYGLRETNTIHSKSALERDIYQHQRATGTSRCPHPALWHGKTLVLQGLLVPRTRITVMAPPMELCHQSFRPLDFKGTYTPMSPLTWDAFSKKVWSIWAFKTLTTPALTTLILLPFNYYRKGAAIDVLLESAALAKAPGPWIGDQAQHMRVFFLTLLRGISNYKYTVLVITDLFSPDAVEQLVEEFRAFQIYLQWNPVYQLSRLMRSSPRLRPIYIAVLGTCYEHHRGAFQFGSIVIGILAFTSNLLH